MAALREIFASFGVQFDRERNLDRGARRVSNMTQRVRGLVATVAGSFALRGFSRFIRSTIDMGDELDKTSQQLGLTVDELERLRYVGNIGGASASEMANALGQLQRRADDAAHGGSETGEAFRRLGVDLRDSEGNLRSARDLFVAVGEGLYNLDNASERTALSMELMGRQGRRMLPMFSQGAAGIERLEAEFNELAGGSLQEFVALSAQAQDDLTRFGVVMTSLRARLAVQFLPGIRRAITSLRGWAAGLRELTAGTRLAESAVIALGIAAAGVALFTIGTWGPILLGAAAVAALALVIDDLWVTMEGGDSILAQMGVRSEQVADVWRSLVGIWDEARATVLNLQDAIRGLLGQQALVRTDSGILGEFGEVSAAYRFGGRARALQERMGGGALAALLRGEGIREAYEAQMATGRRRAPSRSLIPHRATMPGTVFAGTERAPGAGQEPYTVSRMAALAPTGFFTPPTAAAGARTEIDARQEVSVVVHEATDAAAVEQTVRRTVREENERQIRRLAATTGGES